MEPIKHLQVLLVISISLSVALLSFPAEAKCVPRKSSLHSESPSLAPQSSIDHSQSEAKPTPPVSAKPAASPLAPTKPASPPPGNDHLEPSKPRQPVSSPLAPTRPASPPPGNDHGEPKPRQSASSPLAPTKPASPPPGNDHVEPSKPTQPTPPASSPATPTKPASPPPGNDDVEPSKPPSFSPAHPPQGASKKDDHDETEGPGIPFLQHAIDPEIRKVCGCTRNVDLCLASIVPFMNGKKDPASILIMEIQAAIKLSKFTKAKVTKIYEDPTTPSFTGRILSVCVDNYDTASFSLESAVTAINKHDLESVSINLSAALSSYGTCEDAFSERPGEKSPVGDLDDKLGMLIMNCLAISQLLK